MTNVNVFTIVPFGEKSELILLLSLQNLKQSALLKMSTTTSVPFKTCSQTATSRGVFTWEKERTPVQHIHTTTHI